MKRIENELCSVELAMGISLVKVEVKYEYNDGSMSSPWKHNVLKGLSEDGVTAMAQIAGLLAIVDDLDVEEEFLREWAAELAEEEEVPFIYTDRDGKVQNYSPAALWEASSGCEWEQSAEEGIHYGWNV